MEAAPDPRHDVAMANRVLANLGLACGVTSALGHASARVPGEPSRFLVKGREYEFDALAIVGADDMIECDLEGYMVGGRHGLTQPSEVKIHSCIYRARPDVDAVVHVHPRFTVLMSVLDAPLRPMCQEGADLVRRPLSVYPHMKTIQSDEEGQEVAEVLGAGSAMLLRGHGAITVGRSLSEAVLAMARLEEQARMNFLALSAVGPDHPYLSDALLDEMSDRIPLSEQPHFRDVLKGRPPRRDGIWNHHIRVAERNG